MPSINQNKPYPVTLPDFCNLGVLLRILIIVNLLGLGAALVRVQRMTQLFSELQQVSLLIQPTLLLCLVALCALKKPLMRLRYETGALVVAWNEEEARVWVTGLEAVAWAREVETLGAGEIVLTSMDADGTKNGYDLEITRAVSEAVKSSTSAAVHDHG